MKCILNEKIRSFLFLLACLSVAPVMAESEDGRHELENLQVSIPAVSYKKSQFVETEEIKGKTYIKGKKSSYNKKGEANASTLLQPHAEYVIKSKLPGGTYNVTVFYTIDKDEAPEVPRVSIGMDLQKAHHLEIKNKLINSVKTSFKVSLLKGKHHTVKLWFPSAGVKVREVKISRALLPKKKVESKD